MGLPQTYPKGDSERKTALLYVLTSVCCKSQNWGRTFHGCATVYSTVQSLYLTLDLWGFVFTSHEEQVKRGRCSLFFFFFAAQSIWLAFKAGGHKCHTLSLLGALINKSSTTAQAVHTQRTWIWLLSAVRVSPCLILGARCAYCQRWGSHTSSASVFKMLFGGVSDQVQPLWIISCRL